LALESLFQLGTRNRFAKQKRYGYLTLIGRGVRKILGPLSVK
jgi:hypothetical protein